MAVQRAAERTLSGLTMNNMSVANFIHHWQEPCAALGCSPGSLVDIVQCTNGLAAEFVEVKAPAHVMRIHIRSMRKTFRGVMKWIFTDMESPSFQDFVTLLDQGQEHSEHNQRYTSTLRDAGSVMDAAFMSMENGGTALVSDFGRSWGFSADAPSASVARDDGFAAQAWTGLAGKFNKVCPCGQCVLSFNIAMKVGFTPAQLYKVFKGQPPKCAAAASFGTTLFLGCSPLPGFSAGFAVSASLKLSCKPDHSLGMTFSMSFGASGSFAFTRPSSYCPTMKPAPRCRPPICTPLHPLDFKSPMGIMGYSRPLYSCVHSRSIGYTFTSCSVSLDKRKIQCTPRRRSIIFSRRRTSPRRRRYFGGRRRR